MYKIYRMRWFWIWQVIIGTFFFFFLINFELYFDAGFYCSAAFDPASRGRCTETWKQYLHVTWGDPPLSELRNATLVPLLFSRTPFWLEACVSTWIKQQSEQKCHGEIDRLHLFVIRNPPPQHPWRKLPLLPLFFEEEQRNNFLFFITSLKIRYIVPAKCVFYQKGMFNQSSLIHSQFHFYFLHGSKIWRYVPVSCKCVDTVHGLNWVSSWTFQQTLQRWMTLPSSPVGHLWAPKWSYLLYSMKLCLFHIQVEKNLFWVHVRRFTVLSGGFFFFNKYQCWPTIQNVFRLEANLIPINLKSDL